MRYVLGYPMLFFLYLAYTLPTWFPLALAGAVLLRCAGTMKGESRKRRYAVGAAVGLFLGALVGMGTFVYADLVLRILNEWAPGRRPGWLVLAGPLGAIGVGGALSVIFMLATAIAHAIAPSARDRCRGGPEAHN